jgi:hypothetical protein
LFGHGLYVLSTQPGLLNKHANKKHQDYRKQHECGSEIIRFFLIFHFLKEVRLASHLLPKAYLTTGGSSNVWKGAGLGTVHSNPSAPSQG